MDPIEFYYKISEEYRGKVVELPKHKKLEPYQNYDKKLSVPNNAQHLILAQMGILSPTIMYLDEEGCPTTSRDHGILLFTDTLEKRLGLIFEKQN